MGVKTFNEIVPEKKSFNVDAKVSFTELVDKDFIVADYEVFPSKFEGCDEFAVILVKSNGGELITTTSSRVLTTYWDTSVAPVTDAHGRRQGILILTVDVSERKKMEAALRKLSQFQENIIDNANVWLDVLDEKANVVVWNKAAEVISGYSQEEVVGHGRIWEWRTYCTRSSNNCKDSGKPRNTVRRRSGSS